jgi:hypothetical protein
MIFLSNFYTILAKPIFLSQKFRFTKVIARKIKELLKKKTDIALRL